MEILLWLVPAAVVTVLAMCWVGWLGRHDRRRYPPGDPAADEAALQRLGRALEHPRRGTSRYAAPARRPDRSTGLVARTGPGREPVGGE